MLDAIRRFYGNRLPAPRSTSTKAHARNFPCHLGENKWPLMLSFVPMMHQARQLQIAFVVTAVTTSCLLRNQYSSPGCRGEESGFTCALSVG